MGEAGFLFKLSDSILDMLGRRLDVVARHFDGRVIAETPSSEAFDEAELLYLRARTLMRAGNVQAALPLFVRAQHLVPSFEDAVEGYGEGLDRTGAIEQASSMYEAQRQLRASARGPAPDRSFVLRRVGRMTSEIAEYTWLLRSVNDRPFPYVVRGHANLASGRPWRAVVDYIAALGCDPTLVEVIALKGEALAMVHRYDEALSAFNEALIHRPNDPDALSGRAIVHIACGRLTDADADWRHQLAVMPLDRSAARACVALRLADYAMARPELDRALERQPKDPYWYLYRLAAARRIGEPLVVEPPQATMAWPAPLLELHAGRMSEKDVLRLADNAERLVEAYFQLGILDLRNNPEGARGYFERVVELSQSSLIEHSAACHELTRWKR